MVLENKSDHLQAVILVLLAGSDPAMSQQFQHFLPTGYCSPRLVCYFHGKFIPRKLHSVPAVPMSRLPARLRGARP
jgi:hypothetical protein